MLRLDETQMETLLLASINIARLKKGLRAMDKEEFQVKDSGERKLFGSGMVRDTATGKVDYTLAIDGPMFNRWATHLTRACLQPDGSPGKYPPRNWMLATGEEEYERFRQSAFRHFLAWMDGDRDEDHAAAVFFNINGAEYVRSKSALNAR